MRAKVLVMVTGLLMMACGSCPNSPSSTKPRVQEKEEEVFKTISEDCFASHDSKTFQIVQNECENRNQKQIRDLLASGKVIALKKGTQVKVVHGGVISKISILFKDGEDTEEATYLVSSEFLE